MIYILPNTNKAFSKMESNLNEIISKQIPFESEKTHIVIIPRFNILSSLNLKEVLENIGLEKIFNKEAADFSGK
jgi:serine protease inhibitor